MTSYNVIWFENEIFVRLNKYQLGFNICAVRIEFGTELVVALVATFTCSGTVFYTISNCPEDEVYCATKIFAWLMCAAANQMKQRLRHNVLLSLFPFFS